MNDELAVDSYRASSSRAYVNSRARTRRVRANKYRGRRKNGGSGRGGVVGRFFCNEETDFLIDSFRTCNGERV